MTLRQFSCLVDGENPNKAQRDMGSLADLLMFQKMGKPT